MEGTGGWRRASIHIHPGVATGTLITCFNLPTADWASICHSKSVIARGATPSVRYHHHHHRGSCCLLCVLPLLPYWSFSTFVQPRTHVDRTEPRFDNHDVGLQSTPGFQIGLASAFVRRLLAEQPPPCVAIKQVIFLVSPFQRVARHWRFRSYSTFDST